MGIVVMNPNADQDKPMGRIGIKLRPKGFRPWRQAVWGSAKVREVCSRIGR